MRATKAYIASLGTTGLLLAFAASLLLLVGTLLAFNAWPGSEIRDAVESVLVDDDEDSVQVSGPEQVARDAAPAAAAVAGATGSGPGSTTGTGGGSGGFDGGSGTPGGGFGGGFGGGGGGGGGPITGGGTTLPADPSIDSGSGTNQVADGTERVTGNLGDAIGRVSPELGDTVSETGEALSDIVRDLPDAKVDGGGANLGD
jgi:hypothetical protein